jgi:hypothetical protein
LFFKHPGYLAEQEYRFLKLFPGGYVPPPEALLRKRGDTEVRYRAIDWRALAPDSLKVIRIGPAADFDAERSRIEQLLDALGLSHVDIVRSPIPYRVARGI